MVPLNNITDQEIMEYSIVISPVAILGFVHHAMLYASPKIPKEKWVLVIGLLGGRLEPENKILFIEDIVAMASGSATHVEISDYTDIQKGQSELKRKGLACFGWYHSNPSYNLFLSNEDVNTQIRWQTLWSPSIALVVDPELVDGVNWGFKIFRVNMKTRKYYEVPFRIKGAFNAANLYETLKFYETKFSEANDISKKDDIKRAG